jgi:hypothetical protein
MSPDALPLEITIPSAPQSEPQEVNGPAGPAPVRPASSVRRTSTVDMTWPGGLGTQLRLDGRARDAVTTSPDDAPVVVSEATTSVGVGPMRVIDEIVADPAPDGLQNLVGARGGGHLRGVLDEFLPEERAGGTLLNLLLDDISGCSLIAGFAWSRWSDQWMMAERRSTMPQPTEEQMRAHRQSLEGVCIGFRPGASALSEGGLGRGAHRIQPVPPLVNPSDPHGWHPLAELPEVSMRRARRIDAWVDDTHGVIVIDSAFQDSAGDPAHGRVAIHEYLLRATADAETGTLLSVDPDPRVLPFLECPSAKLTAQVLVDTPLRTLRSTVLERLAKTNGCTHLNDALRALAEAPVMLRSLTELAA